MNKILQNVIRLKKYFRLSCFSTEIKKSDLLSSNESLKDFGRLWTNNKADVLIMAEVVKYEILADGGYDEKDVARIKQTLGKVIKFLMQCSSEWEEYEQSQQKKK